MKSKMASSPFHHGERQVQEKLGVRDRMENFGKRVIRDHMPQQHREFYQQLPFILAGFIDDQGWPWASFLYGEEGFIQSPSDKTLELNAKIVTGDPLHEALNSKRHLALLGIDLPSRRRNRLSAAITEVQNQTIQLEVIQSFGNCPQYIQARQMIPHQHQEAPEQVEITGFNQEIGKLIAQSDTFFVASHYQNNSHELNSHELNSHELNSHELNSAVSMGADVSHRGGKPGFVRVDSDTTLTIPDYLGNFHFNTLGNFLLNPKAGLLFIDFENGHILSLTGRVEILWESDELEYFDGAQRLWQFHLEKGVYLKYALPFKWQFEGYSPTTEVTGSWAQSDINKQNELQKDSWQQCAVTKIVQESSSVKSVYLQAETGGLPRFKAGQFLTVKANINGKQQIRTYTLSSSPNDDFYRISVKHEAKGVFSSFLHEQLQIGDTLEFKSPTGEFYIDPDIDRPAVLLAAGIGITPMVSMARHIIQDVIRTRSIRQTIMVCSSHNIEQRAFFNELNALAAQSDGHLRIIWVVSNPESHAVEGKDYHVKGHISGELLQAILPIDDYEFYVCGPSGFTQSMYDISVALGVADKRIMAEAFGPASLQRQLSLPVDGVIAAPPAEEAIIEFSSSQFEQSWSKEDGNLLDFSEAHGLSPEFGCRSGQCGSCKVKLLEGEVHYKQNPSCSYDSDEVVLCCATPAKSSEVDEVKLRLAL
jgi:ferredoxin-NADP reductase/predicted pyridoxine 5'-phosphate oxidase superfamily flavin-nucleotide-binding protein